MEDLICGQINDMRSEVTNEFIIRTILNKKR